MKKEIPFKEGVSNIEMDVQKLKYCVIDK